MIKGTFESISGLSVSSTLLNGIYKNADLDNHLFSFYLNRNPGSSDSRLILGEIDQSLIGSNEIDYFDVVHKDYWMIKADNILFGDDDMGVCKSNDCALILDSGTSVMAGPKDGILSLLHNLHSIDCKHIDYESLPEIK